MMSSAPRIAFVGAGNVATHLAQALYDAGCTITACAASRASHASELAARFGAQAVTPDAVPSDTDFIIISATDGSIAQIAAELPQTRGIVVHTSGSIPVDVLAARHERCGVLYPLQTFSRSVPVDMTQVPFFTEADSTATLESIDKLARMVSSHVYHADSDKRKLLHIAGVLSSNFTVYLLGQCREVLSRGGYPLEVVKPLVEATVSKAFAVGPYDAMTGPARRGDTAVIAGQSESLDEPLRTIYNLISESIYNQYHK